MQPKSRLLRHVAAIGVVAMIAVASTAHAADVVQSEPPPAAPLENPPLNTWDGPYAGISLGYGFGGKTTPDTGDIKPDGFVGDVFAGYNLQNGMFVYGIEGDVGYANVTGSNGVSKTETGFEGSLRARLGVAVTDDILLYGTGGGAAQRMKVSDPTGSDSNAMLGWTVGAGMDLKLTPQVFGRVEYRYTDFGSQDFTTGLGTQSIDSSENRVTFGVGMKF